MTHRNSLARIVADTRDDLFRKPPHLRLKGLELQHEQLDPRGVKIPNAAGNGVIASDQSRRGAAITADSRGLLHRLHHDDLRIGIGALNRPHRRVVSRQCQQAPIRDIGFSMRLPRDHER
jgi:hypothetical protein